MQRCRVLGKHTFGSAPGYFATFKGKKWYYVTADQLKKIIGSGDNGDLLKRQLVADGLMAGASTGKFVVQRKIFPAKGNKGHRWVHAFRAKIRCKIATDFFFFAAGIVSTIRVPPCRLALISSRKSSNSNCDIHFTKAACSFGLSGLALVFSEPCCS